MAKKKKKKTLSRSDLIDLLNLDLSNELKHMMFYLHHAAVVSGLHRAELKELLAEEAAGEFKHVQEFSDLLVGLGAVPCVVPQTFSQFDDGNPKDILQYALRMEDQVVENYSERIDQATELGGVDGKVIQIFLEDQLLDSRSDADHMRQMLKRL